MKSFLSTYELFFSFSFLSRFKTLPPLDCSLMSFIHHPSIIPSNKSNLNSNNQQKKLIRNRKGVLTVNIVHTAIFNQSTLTIGKERMSYCVLFAVAQFAAQNVKAFAPLSTPLSFFEKVELSKFHRVTLSLQDSDINTPSEQDDFAQMTVAELKDKLRGLGLKVGGNKSELINRLLEASTVGADEKQEAIVDENSNLKISQTPIEGDFESLGLASFLERPIVSQGWETPTPIQSLAIPEILRRFSPISSSEDEASTLSLWAEAPTGKLGNVNTVGMYKTSFFWLFNNLSRFGKDGYFRFTIASAYRRVEEGKERIQRKSQSATPGWRSKHS